MWYGKTWCDEPRTTNLEELPGSSFFALFASPPAAILSPSYFCGFWPAEGVLRKKVEVTHSLF
jgi:hypothetical protein